jgi:regulatory protein
VDAYTTALTLLSRRELSTRQLRERLARKQFDASEIDRVIQQLEADRTLDDRRVAFARARTDASIKGYGRRRALQHVQQLGVDAEIAAAAVAEVFADIDEAALIDAAIDKRLRGGSVRALAARDKGRLVRHLVSRGFEPAQVLAHLRRKGAEIDG